MEVASEKEEDSGIEVENVEVKLILMLADQMLETGGVDLLQPPEIMIGTEIGVEVGLTGIPTVTVTAVMEASEIEMIEEVDVVVLKEEEVTGIAGDHQNLSRSDQGLYFSLDLLKRRRVK